MDIDACRSASKALEDSLTHAKQALYAANRFHSAGGVVDALEKLANSMAKATWPPVFEDRFVLAAADLPKRSTGNHTFSHAHQEATWRCLKVLEAGWKTLDSDVYWDAMDSVDRLSEQAASEIARLFNQNVSTNKLLAANRSKDNLEMLTLLGDFQEACKPVWEYPFGVSELIKIIKHERALVLIGSGENATDKSTTVKRRGRKKADYATEKRESEIAEEWAKARDTGTYKPDFAKEKQLSLTDLEKLLNRVSKRNRRSDK